MRVLASAFLGSLLLAVTPGIAHAHADVVRTSPPNGSVVAKPPDAVSVTFSEKVELVAAMLRGAAGQEIPSRADVSGTRLVITPTATLDGQRSVTASWTVVSDDGHQVSGSSAFVIRGPALAGARVALDTMPSVPAVLTSNRPGVTSVVFQRTVRSG
ncbi:MAG: copper resistance protein CopC, partial [Actinomycetales bacterium]